MPSDWFDFYLRASGQHAWGAYLSFRCISIEFTVRIVSKLTFHRQLNRLEWSENKLKLFSKLWSKAYFIIHNSSKYIVHLIKWKRRKTSGGDIHRQTAILQVHSCLFECAAGTIQSICDYISFCRFFLASLPSSGAKKMIYSSCSAYINTSCR